MRRLALTACALVPLLATGCGPRPGATSDEARAAARTFLDACARDDAQAATEVLTEPARDTFIRARSPTAGCLDLANLALPGLTEAQVRQAFDRARVTVTHVHAIYAEAEISAPGGARGGLQLDDVGGDWRVAGGID